MEKQVVVCRICGSSAEIFNAKADEAYIWFQCSACQGIFMMEYQLEDDAPCAVCESPVKIIKAAKNYLWLQCHNCNGIFRSQYQLSQPPAAVSAE